VTRARPRNLAEPCRSESAPRTLVRLQAHMVREVQVLFRHALSGL
jgi:hypothetical protein